MPVLLAEAPDWLVFDVWSMMLPVLHSGLYADDFHFPGKLTQRAWHVIARMLCPGP